MRRPEVSEASIKLHGGRTASIDRHRRAVVAATLVGGTAVLGTTLAAAPGSTLFYGLGFLAASIWIAGGLLSGSIPWTRNGLKEVRLVHIVVPIMAGAALFGAFFAAKLVAARIPVLHHSVESVLARADAGPRLLVLVVALVNGIGEEVLFRGALYDAFDNHPAVWATAIYCIVTVATLNVALVVAAAIMGTVFSLERRASGDVLAPLLTHLSWSTLVLLFLPR